MNTDRPPRRPVTEAELHAFVDGQLPAERQREIEAYLADRPDEAQRVEAYRAQKRELHALFDPVLDEAAAAAPAGAAGAAAQRRGTCSAWPPGWRSPWSAAPPAGGCAAAGLTPGSDAARMAAVAPAPGAPTWCLPAVLRSVPPSRTRSTAPTCAGPVEVDAAHEDQLVAWLSKRMGAPMKPPHLQALGYTLEGGRLLPGGQGPVAQFMYRDEPGSKLTLYVSNDIADVGSAAAAGREASEAGEERDTAFRFAQEGAVNVFYWVDGPFGYALSSDADRSVLARVSAEVYQQLGARAEGSSFDSALLSPRGLHRWSRDADGVCAGVGDRMFQSTRDHHSARRLTASIAQRDYGAPCPPGSSNVALIATFESPQRQATHTFYSAGCSSSRSESRSICMFISLHEGCRSSAGTTQW